MFKNKEERRALKNFVKVIGIDIQTLNILYSNPTDCEQHEYALKTTITHLTTDTI